MASIYTERKENGISVNTKNKQEEQLLIKSIDGWKIKHRNIIDSHNDFTYEKISESEAIMWLEKNNHRPFLLTGRKTALESR